MRFLKPSLFALGLLTMSGCTTIDYEIDFGDEAEPNFVDYVGAPNIVRGTGDGGDLATGIVFVDSNQNSVQDEDEDGLEGVKVSNGREVVLTGSDGSYALPKRPDMAVFVIQPSGYQVPHDDNWVPQFAYQHKPNGSPKKLRYGGLPATGPLPQAINFPLIKSGVGDDFACAILGDPQTYANQDISYFRDSTIDDLLDRNDETKPDCVLALGDVMGDDLGLIPRMAEVMSVLEAPQWWVHGNHDFDFDADFDEDSADSWRNLYGPNYFAFEIGDVLFISLDNVVYPCTAEDAKQKGREFCVTRDRKAYNGRITDEQMAFVENLLALTPEDKLVVVAHHIPFVTFVDTLTPFHSTYDVTGLYRLLADRRALSLSGHTHALENFSPGDTFEGWSDAIGSEALPFRHIVAGAGSGGWFHGDFDVHGVPMALQRMGAPMGWLDLQFDGADYVETYYGANTGRDRRMWLSINTPDFRTWFETIGEWALSDRRTRDPIPPLSIHDLPDVKILTPEDLAGGSFLTANVWDGTTETRVSAEIGGQTLILERTQTARGDAPKIGAEWADPFATQRQLSVARYAMQSRSGEERNQGYEAFKGSSFGPAAPQPQTSAADRNMHLWRLQLPADLPLGVHRIDVTSVDRHARETVDTIVIEVREERPPMRFRKDVFFATPDGPPIR